MEKLELNEEEIGYLTWRDIGEHWAEKKLELWDREIEAYGGTDIYFEEDEGKRFVMLTQLINRCEKMDRPDLLNKLVGTRYKLKNNLMKKVAPDILIEISDSDIDRARSYPLWKIMGLPRPKNIKCPSHDDANPSFQVSLWGFCHTCRHYVDGIGYLMEKSIVTFSEAVKDLANR
jgi:hypothetical protein